MTDNNRRNVPGRPRGDKQNEPVGWRGPGKSLIFWIAIILVAIIVVQYWSGVSRDVAEITYSEFVDEVERGNVLDVTFEERNVEGTLKEPQRFSSVNSPDAFTKFKTRIPFDDNNYELVNKLEESGTKIVAKDQSPSIFSYFSLAAPWLILIVIWLFFLRQMQGGGGPRGLFSFGKSKAKLLTEDRPKVTFKDVAGADEAKEELEE
ncbi:MAG: ATP-dependent metallopeptidase FtsH/Yme1/Tma family protein, partial [Candidatus Zixiibacteriota bacterium]